MHSMQAGYLEKAQKYTDKALMQLEKLKSERPQRPLPRGPRRRVWGRGSLSGRAPGCLSDCSLPQSRTVG